MATIMVEGPHIVLHNVTQTLLSMISLNSLIHESLGNVHSTQDHSTCSSSWTSCDIRQYL